MFWFGENEEKARFREEKDWRIHLGENSKNKKIRRREALRDLDSLNVSIKMHIRI